MTQRVRGEPVRFTPPLPCSALTADGVARCGQDATVGTLYPIGGGQHILQPLCRDRVAALQRLYGVEPAVSERTFTIAADGRAITCLLCGKTSYNPQDVAQLFCGHCHVFHKDA